MLCLLLIFLIELCLFEKEKNLCIVGEIVSIYVERWKQHWPFKEESEKWQESGGDDMLVDHNDEGTDAIGG